MAKHTYWFSQDPFSEAVNRTELLLEDLENRLPPAAHTLVAASTAANTLTLGALNTAEASGEIATADEQDLYRIQLGIGDRLTAAVTAQLAGSGLEPVLRVFSEYGQELAIDNQEGGDPQLTFQANAPGDYFVGVSSAGNSQYNPTVFDSGSTGTTTGTYTLDLAVRKNQPLQSDLASSSFRLAQTTAAWGDTVLASFNIENRGGANAGAFSVQLYVSPDPNINPSNSTPLLATPLAMDSLTAGSKWSVEGLALTLPTGLDTLKSGPVYIGLRITLTNPGQDSGTSDKGGVHRGEDFESLTIVTPVTTNVTDLAQIDPSLNIIINGILGVNQSERYQFTISQTLGAGQFTATAQPNSNNSFLPQLALYGGAEGQTLLVQTQGEINDPSATLTEYIQPGTYFLSVSSDQAGSYQLTTAMTAASSALQTVPTGPGPSAIAVGDINNDGDLDLVVADSNFGKGNTLSILMGNGNGTFLPTQTVTVGRDPVAVAIADLNGDGKPDLVVANEEDNTVGVLLGNGNGTFQPMQTYAVGHQPSSVAVADLTGNGILDIVVVNTADDTVGVLLGNGNGTFQPMQTYAVGHQPSSVAVADLNGDGIPDIVVANTGSNTVGVLLGEGDGTFGSMHSFPVGEQPSSVAVADLTGNGILDIVVANSGDNTVGVLLGKGDGTFAMQSQYSVGTQPLSLVVADINDDGKPDIVVSNNNNTVSYLFGSGNGTFATQQTSQLPQSSSAVVVAAINGDGNPDLIATDSGSANQPGSGISVLLGNGDGSFQSQPVLPVGVGPVSLAVGDFNGDGRPDVAVASVGSQEVTVELGNGDGTFSPQTPIPVGNRPMAVATADLNNDGRADLVVANFDDNTVGVMLGNGDGTFRPEVTYPVGLGPCSLVLADLTGDGIDDIVVVNNGDGTVGVLLGNGDGTFQPMQSYTVGAGNPIDQVGLLPGAGPISVAVADVNGDGIPDIIVGNDQDSSVDVLLGEGHGTFQPQRIIPLLDQPSALAVADVNGDGKTDIIVVNSGASTVGVLLGNGNGTFQTQRIFGVGQDPQAVAVADVNGDGLPDLVVTNSKDGTVSVLLGLGDGDFQNQRIFDVGQDPLPVVVADLNKDGKPDILVGNFGDNTLTALLGNGDGTFTIATATNSAQVSNTPYLVDLTGAVDSTGQPILDSVILDSAGNILFRQGLPGGSNQFEPPVTLNPTRSAQDVAPLQTSSGWVVAAADSAPDPNLSTPGHLVYTISLYSVTLSGKVNPPTIALSTSLVPTQIFAADLSGDDREGDLVIANSLNNSIQVAIQQPDGTFGSLLTLSTGNDPSDVTFADVNGDGLTDIIVTNQASGDVSIFINDKNHSFATSERIRAGSSLSDINTSSTITTVAGNKFQNYFGDGGPATDATLNNPVGIAADSQGDLYITDYSNNVIREVLAGTDIIKTVVGTGSAGYAGDGGPATSALLSGPESVALDAAGNLYISDTNNNVVREVIAKTGIIETVAGSGVAGYSGDHGLATNAELNGPSGIAVDDSGNLYISDTNNNVIREVAVGTGVITTVAGTGVAGYSGDSGLATATELDGPLGIAVDGSGNLYIADTFNHLVREVAVGTGLITTVAGTGLIGTPDDGQLATDAELLHPECLAIDQAGDLYISDIFTNMIYEVSAATQVITIVAGVGPQGYTGDNGPATAALLSAPVGVALDGFGNLYIVDNGNNVIREVTATTEIITTVAGSESHEYSGLPVLATSAVLSSPGGAVVDTHGNLYIADSTNNVIREVAAGTGIITTIAGNGIAGYSGDGGFATSAELNDPDGVAVDSDGNVYIADSFNNVIRMVAAGTGIITTIAGTGPNNAGYSGDGGPATLAELNGPESVAIDSAGNLYIADSYNNAVREIAANTGIITTVAGIDVDGIGVAGYSGDGGPGISAELDNPEGVAIDAAGNLYIADSFNNVVREVSAGTGIITTVAGTGVAGYSGDDGPATSAELNNPEGVAVDASGNLYISDFSNNRIRRVAAQTGIITTFAGTGTLGYSGDNGPATLAMFSFPEEIAVDAEGNLYIADSFNNVIRKVATAQTSISSLAVSASLTTGNFTGRGNDDLLVVNRGAHSFSILAGNDSGEFASPQAALTTSTSDGLSINNDPGPVVAGDFNSLDGGHAHSAGQEDVAILMEDTGEVWIFTNNGNGTFEHTDTIPVGLGATGLSLVSGSEPGLYDLLVGNQSGDILQLIGTGDGTFQPPPSLTGNSAPIAVQKVGSANTPVALVANQQANLVTLQSTTNGSTYSSVQTLTTTNPSSQLAPGDVKFARLDKGSTLPDAIVIASGSNSVLVYRATGLNIAGDPIYAQPASYSVGTDPVDVTVADINGDGIPDLLIANKGSNDISVLFGSDNSSGDWVGIPGPRLKSAGAGPLSANLVANPSSPGGYDLGITNQDGTVDLLPGRGQGFFDDRSPQILSLGTTLSQPPTLIPGTSIAYAVSNTGLLMRFDMSDLNTPATILPGQEGVLAAQLINASEIVEVRSGGIVNEVDTTTGSVVSALSPQNGLPLLPSSLALLETDSGLEALVTAENSNTIYEFRATSTGIGEPVTVEIGQDFTPVGSSLALASTLFTTTSVPGGSGPVPAGPAFNTLLTASATGVDPGLLARIGGLSDETVVLLKGEQLLASLKLDFEGLAFSNGPDPLTADSPPLSTTRDGVLTGTTEALERLVEAVRGGTWPETVPGMSSPAKKTDLLEQLLDSLRTLPQEGNRPTPPGEQSPDEPEGNNSQVDSIATVFGSVINTDQSPRSTTDETELSPPAQSPATRLISDKDAFEALTHGVEVGPLQPEAVEFRSPRVTHCFKDQSGDVEVVFASLLLFSPALVPHERSRRGSMLLSSWIRDNND